MTVASSSTYEDAYEVLEIGHITAQFDVIASDGNIGKIRPNPSTYLTLPKHLDSYIAIEASCYSQWNSSVYQILDEEDNGR